MPRSTRRRSNTIATLPPVPAVLATLVCTVKGCGRTALRAKNPVGWLARSPQEEYVFSHARQSIITASPIGPLGGHDDPFTPACPDTPDPPRGHKIGGAWLRRHHCGTLCQRSLRGGFALAWRVGPLGTGGQQYADQAVQ